MGMLKNIKKIKKEVFYWKCKNCGKKIFSLYKEQIDSLVEQHIKFCKEEKE